MIFIIIKITYGTKVFRNIKTIEKAYQVVYQKVIQDENYLELSEEETVIQLLNYIKNTSYLKLL